MIAFQSHINPFENIQKIYAFSKVNGVDSYLVISSLYISLIFGGEIALFALFFRVEIALFALFFIIKFALFFQKICLIFFKGEWPPCREHTS